MIILETWQNLKVNSLFRDCSLVGSWTIIAEWIWHVEGLLTLPQSPGGKHYVLVFVCLLCVCMSVLV